MMCLDNPSEIKLYGEVNDIIASTIVLEINKCHEKDYCESDKKIEEFLSDKRLVIIYN